MVQILNEQTLDWRFDDWKTMREVRFTYIYFALPLTNESCSMFQRLPNIA